MQKSINTALASYGMSGEIFHAPFLKAHKGFTIRKILERTKQNAKAKVPDATIVRDYKEILHDSDVELIIVNTPNPLHYQMCREALEYGKHVVVEKPFTVKSSEAEELIDLAKTKNRVLSVYHNKRFETDFQSLKKVISEGKTGEVKLFESSLYRWKPEIGNKRWKVDEGPGSGLLYDLGSHLIDQALQLFGKPKSVLADLGTLRPGAKTNDYFTVILDYNDKKVVLKSFLLSAIAGPRFAVYGTKGSYLEYGSDIQEEMLSYGVTPGTHDWKKYTNTHSGKIHFEDKDVEIKAVSSTYWDYFENLFNAIRKNEELLVKPEEARDVIRIIELANQSVELNKRIECSF